MEHAELAAVFAHEGVAAAYRHRPPYPAEVFGILTGLFGDRPRTVLDLGAGEGALARPLAALVDRVDAVDVSAAMIAVGRERPGGSRENLRWITGAAETVDLTGPYGLVTAGASLHWMAWPTLMPRLLDLTAEGAPLAVVEHGERDVPWQDALNEVIVRHSRNPRYDPDFTVVDVISDGGHFAETGRAETAPVTYRQSVESYVERFHSTSSLARENMPAEEAADFDREVREVVAPFVVDGGLDLKVVATVVWGKPLA
ncbi:class I SAM-dependent methyltransferase [Phytomonospora endophytica]|uniref:SAM-dependent methyltransferase n=1 Tax=Phytomonospora endophytica TaxID=714109 RepID=A0A841FTQ2_9ACTN|nr:class I SAM-dependent methyltransferase [Phytomonospora endophytica]MBB6039715.1 SAM-dependent methyltransferase [Phytomonospora endophytica]GIG70949.1 hypothetical protein Pen01_72440 [Phytomonospora endophytica]